ncbi:MAG: uncharacterized protein JWR82_566 [Blastococcus sp.]|nr:uncharacterized protein [Blastococcus sp.]
MAAAAARPHTPPVPTPSPESFAALARSSPWRWSTLRFTGSWPGDRYRAGPVRAWLRRPDVLRVETLDGGLLQVVGGAEPAVAVLDPDGDSRTEASWGRGPEPALRPDGLVDRRPDRRADGDWTSFDAPMYQDYRWIAMLDPVELADGIDRNTGGTVPALVVDDVTEVEHAGRPAWEAVVRTTPAYEPRCGCCPLLRSRYIDLLEYRDHPENVLEHYPEAYRVRLDVGTGVCVLTAEIGVRSPGGSHDLRIEAVDERMADALFVAPARRPTTGWAPVETAVPGIAPPAPSGGPPGASEA